MCVQVAELTDSAHQRLLVRACRYSIVYEDMIIALQALHLLTYSLELLTKLLAMSPTNSAKSLDETLSNVSISFTVIVKVLTH